MGKGLVTKVRERAVECRRLAWAVLKLIYRKMETSSKGAMAATMSPIRGDPDALRQLELVCPSTTGSTNQRGEEGAAEAAAGQARQHSAAAHAREREAPPGP